MNYKLKNAFGSIYADEQLKNDTLSFLRDKLRQPQKNHNTRFKRLAVTLACLIVLSFTGIFAHNSYFTEVMYVDVDINPSVELSVNRFNRIIGVYAYNTDGQTLLSTLDLMHKPYDSAISLITGAAIEEGFLTNGGLVSVTVQSQGGAGEAVILQTLHTNISSAARGHYASVRIDAFCVDDKTRVNAHEQNLSPAKYLAIMELREVDPTATVDSCRNHTIGEIRERTQQHGGGHHGKSKGFSEPSAINDEDQGVTDAEVPIENSHHAKGHHGKGHQ